MKKIQQLKRKEKSKTQKVMKKPELGKSLEGRKNKSTGYGRIGGGIARSYSGILSSPP